MSLLISGYKNLRANINALLQVILTSARTNLKITLKLGSFHSRVNVQLMESLLVIADYQDKKNLTIISQLKNRSKFMHLGATVMTGTIY
jgi:hypothetical protein